MQFDPIGILINGFWSSPLWVKVVLMLAVLLGLGWPSLLAQQSTSPRQSRRRWPRRSRRYSGCRDY
jgi:hypothetical protein